MTRQEELLAMARSGKFLIITRVGHRGMRLYSEGLGKDAAIEALEEVRAILEEESE